MTKAGRMDRGVWGGAWMEGAGRGQSKKMDQAELRRDQEGPAEAHGPQDSRWSRTGATHPAAHGTLWGEAEASRVLRLWMWWQCYQVGDRGCQAGRLREKGRQKIEAAMPPEAQSQGQQGGKSRAAMEVAERLKELPPPRCGDRIQRTAEAVPPSNGKI